MKKSNIIIILGGLVASIVACNIAMANDYPRASIADMPNGVASTFVGEWSIQAPEGKSMSSRGTTTCKNPVHIKSTDPASINYISTTGTEVEFMLSAFMDRSVWMPELGESTLAVWTAKHEFFAYQVDMRTGKAKWDEPLVYRRCGAE